MTVFSVEDRSNVIRWLRANLGDEAKVIFSTSCTFPLILPTGYSTNAPGQLRVPGFTRPPRWSARAAAISGWGSIMVR